MWYLVNQHGYRIYLKPNQETVIGRKKTNVVLTNDKSISKEHASISITKLEEIRSNEPTSICKIRDLKSKYGTFILHEHDVIQLTETECILKHQDTIRFGLQNHVFKVINVPMITTVSTLCDNEIERLKQLMEEIDGVIITDNDWRRASTHLTVGNAILTLKLASAMASALPIVTMKYWDKVKFAIDNGQQLPDSNNFVPPISEPLIAKRKVLISPNEKRTRLFENLTFIHFSITQYRKYKKIIRIAGGISQLFERTNLTTTEFCSPNMIVLQYSDNDSTQITENIFCIYGSIQQALKAKNYRMISDVEICLAILHCSTEKYCNPMYKFAKLLKRSERKNDSCEVLNLDTQDETAKVSPLPTSFFSTSTTVRHCIIPETLDISQESLLNVSDVVTQSTEKQRYNEIQCIKETPNDASTTMKNIQVTQPKEISNLSKTTSVNVRQHVIPETMSSISSQELQSGVNYIFTQSTEKQRYNEIQCIKETPNDASTTMKNVQGTQSKEISNLSKTASVKLRQHVIPETLCSITSQELQSDVNYIFTQPTEKQEYNKIQCRKETPNDASATMKNVQVTQPKEISNLSKTTSVKVRERVIPETLCSITSQELQSDVNYIFTQPTEKQEYNKIQCRKETPNDASATMKNVQVTQPKEISNLSKTTSVKVRERVIPETLSGISSQELHSDVNFADTQPTKKGKCNELQYIDETPNDASATMASTQDTQFNENNSTFPNVLSQIIRYSNHDNQTVHKQNKRQPVEIVILSDDEIELKPARQSKNNNTNSNKDFTHNTSNDIFETSNSRDENKQMQPTACLIDNRIAAANLKEMCEVKRKIVLKNVHSVTLQVEKKHNKETTYLENSSTPHTAEPLSIPEHPPVGSVRKEKREHKAQNVTSSALKSNSSLRANPSFKVYKKVAAIIPQKRIKIDNMYVWNKYQTNVNLC